MKPSDSSEQLHLLVLGSLGMLGRDLVERIRQDGMRATGLDMPGIDITKAVETEDLIGSIAPDVVINCAAYTAVDKAEIEIEAAYAVNRDGAANIARACNRLRIPLIHISTDYVFDGSAKRAYREDDAANPISIYGRSKWEGEEAIRSALNEHLIVRTSWLFGSHGNNFVKTILRLAREREELRIVADQHGCPTWTGDLSKALAQISKQILEDEISARWGTYHFCGEGETTWYGFTQAIIEEERQREKLKAARIVPISTTEYPLPAKRPQRSALDCAKIKSAFGIAPAPWRKGLVKVLQEYQKE